MMNDDNDKIIFDSQDRDSVIRKIIEHEERIRHANSHMGEVDSSKHNIADTIHPRGYNYYSETFPYQENDSISLVIAPAWGIVFPPYNLARLSALLRFYGYKVFVHDINIETYHYTKKNYDKDLWDATNFYMWERPVFDDEVFPVIQPILDARVQKIIDDNTDIVGFSLYLTNLLPSLYMMQELKRLKPSVKIVVGGPEAFNDWFVASVTEKFGYDESLIDYRITGEGEQELLSLMKTYRTTPKTNGIITYGGFKSRLDLNQLPYPDYSDYDLSLYEYPNGVSIETSRGCVAQCTFCSETWYWKYRYRNSNRVIEEMKHQMQRYGTRHFWFVDSLVNGAFTEFKNLVHNIVVEGLDISWNSYARCDGRMDADLFKKIAESGCVTLSFGVESGSEKVLTDMKKKIKVWEIENNLRDATNAGMKNHVNWVVGFPTEGPTEFLHSLHVLYNARNWIFAFSPGMTCGDAPFSDIHVNWKNYDMDWFEKPWDITFMSNWTTSEYRNTILHRFIRLKFLQIWLYLATTVSNGTIHDTQRRPNLSNFFQFKRLTDDEIIDYFPQEKNQDFSFFKNDNSIQDKFSASLANEYVPYAWALYKVYGPFEFSMINDRDMDLSDFGGFIASPYWADVKMRVDTNGKLDINITHRFVHETTQDDHRVNDQEIPRRGDMSFPEQTFSLSCNISEFDGSDE